LGKLFASGGVVGHKRFFEGGGIENGNGVGLNS
jgi:hypothetical protein